MIFVGRFAPNVPGAYAPRLANQRFNVDISRFWNNSVEKYCVLV